MNRSKTSSDSTRKYEERRDRMDSNDAVGEENWTVVARLIKLATVS